MKAVVLTNPAPIEERPLKMIELPTPTPAADEILIKVSVCGACHTDLDEAEASFTDAVPPS